MHAGEKIRVEPQLHSVLTTITLFFFGLISPGPNFLVVAQTTLNSGRSAGFVTGLGTAVGDAAYASLGLFGVTRLIAVGHTMMVIEVLGGLYLAWLGGRMIMHRGLGAARVSDQLSVGNTSARSHFWRGLATDLSNPKTVLFFASIFAVTVNPESSRTVRGTMLLGIVLTSIVWRSFLSIVFSTIFIRCIYEKAEHIIEGVVGLFLFFFGLFLIKRAVF